jgi:transposase-like protein
MGVDGHKEVLGIWLESNEGAKFWLKVISELENRAVQDILLACCDGLKGFPRAIGPALPRHRGLVAQQLGGVRPFFDLQQSCDS